MDHGEESQCGIWDFEKGVPLMSKPSRRYMSPGKRNVGFETGFLAGREEEKGIGLVGQHERVNRYMDVNEESIRKNWGLLQTQKSMI